MPKIESRLNTRSEDFETNRAALLEKIEEVRGLEDAVRGHDEKRRAKIEDRGQVIPRERVGLVLHPARTRVVLFEFALADGGDAQIPLEEDGP